MSRQVGTTSRGIRLPILKQGDDLASIVVDSVLLAAKEEGFVRPTLKEAVPGDLALCLPYKTMRSIIEMIEVLDKITPGIATEHTLLYGVEAKYYSAHPHMSKELEVKGIDHLYVAGDGAGLTRGLAQASACGVYIARNIIKRGK